MTRDDITRMAEGSGLDRILGDWLHEFTLDSWPATEIPELERFAALVAAPLEEEIRRLRFCIPEGDAAAAMEYLAYCVEKAVAEEREACAKYVAQSFINELVSGKDVAAAIRARGE